MYVFTNNYTIYMVISKCCNTVLFQVSIMARMIPSPDWFIGVDSFDLCVDGNWLDSITIEVNMFIIYYRFTVS